MFDKEKPNLNIFKKEEEAVVIVLVLFNRNLKAILNMGGGFGANLGEQKPNLGI